MFHATNRAPQVLVVALLLLSVSACFPSLPPEGDITQTNDTVADVGADTTPDTATDSDAPLLNACGGTGPINGPPVDSGCGLCGDGRGACDPNDPAKNRTICVGARALNACQGCSELAGPLGSDCGTCGVLGCDPASAGNAICIEPQAGCDTWLSCDDLNCDISGRACVPGNGSDSACGACLEGRVDIDGACLRATSTPTALTATTDRDERVEIRWEPSPFATGYKVYRCASPTCAEADWALVPNGEVAVTRYDDLNTEAAPEPAAPTLTASIDSPLAVTLTWSAVSPPVARAYQYRVTAVAPAGETAPSMAVTGSRAPRAIDGYEVKVAAGAWQKVGNQTTWSDAAAPAPVLTAGTATASQAQHASFVALAVSGVGATAGPDVAYRVRAVTPTGAGAESATVIGRRAAPTAWTVAWERSAGASAADFELIPNATGNTWNDTDAPADGAVRYYRARITATGAPTVWTAPVSGSRLPPPGVPGNVGATTDFDDRVAVSWNAVPDALGYHVYRNGTKLTSGNGISGTSFNDTAAPAPSAQWAAPGDVAATSSDSAAVTVTWTAPTRPVGADATYQVASVNAAGEGAKSASATGRRARPALVSFEVETSFGQATNWVDTSGTNTTWVHSGAPGGILTGTFTATDGDFRAHVKLVEVAVASAPSVVSYRVRGKLEGGGYTPISGSVSGSRAVGAISRQWQRSATASVGSTYNDIQGATGAQFNDTGAPADGTERYYRLRLSAPGADTVALNPVLGRRLAIVQVSAGKAHNCALAQGGGLWCWGEQSDGRLGNGFIHPAVVEVPVRVAPVTRFQNVSAGAVHTCAVGVDGFPYCWGSNEWGKLGTGDTDRRPIPTKVPTLSNVTTVSARGERSCVRRADGTAWCWGENSMFQLGNGSDQNSLVPQQVLEDENTPLTGVLTVHGDGMGTHTCATKSSGFTHCWGGDEMGNSSFLGRDTLELGKFALPVYGTLDFSQYAMAIGYKHTCAVAQGQLYCWGENSLGELGVENLVRRAFPKQAGPSDLQVAQVAAGGFRTCVLSIAKNVRCWGDGVFIPPATDIPGLVNVDAISAGAYHVCALVAGGLKCWGNNSAGQLGNNSTNNSATPVDVLFP